MIKDSLILQITKKQLEELRFKQRQQTISEVLELVYRYKKDNYMLVEDLIKQIKELKGK